MSPNAPWEDENLFWQELPSKFRPDVGKVLVTGASGYIGGRLVPRLLDRGYKVRVMVRERSPEFKRMWPGCEVKVADALNQNRLKVVLEGIDTAFYLIHSLNLGPKKFQQADIHAAVNFRRIAEEMKIKRIIYLGGLGDRTKELSDHLLSRLEVAEELKKGKVPVTILRAAVIIGSGSASYEILRHLVENLYVIPMPKWARNRCQPIAVRDVIKYLIGTLEMSQTDARSFDIGGKDILTYREMMEELVAILHKKRLFIPFPVTSIKLYSYMASLYTPVPASITQSLVEGIKNEVICQDDSIRGVIPFEPRGYREALLRAMTREEQDMIYTRWSDAYPPAHGLAMHLGELKGGGTYQTSAYIITEKSASSLFKSICSIGGKEGWFRANWMWRLRGSVDRMLMGVGSSRGRRSTSKLRINDVIDFWRIEDLRENQRLLLRAEMKLPGKAWLEFNISDEQGMRKLSVSAYYYAGNIFGKLYWYIFLPFHFYIFKGLLKQIEKRS